MEMKKEIDFNFNIDIDIDSDNDLDLNFEDIQTCPLGFAEDECCCCILRFGIEDCELRCPFMNRSKEAIRGCYSEDCWNCVEAS